MKFTRLKNRSAMLASILVALFVLLGITLFLPRATLMSAGAQQDPGTVYRFNPLEADVAIQPPTEAGASVSLQPGADTAGPIPIGAPNACSIPIILHGSIITGTNPTMLGRLIRNGIPGTCGEGYTCSGVQSTSSSFSYQKFDFTNASGSWQCIDVEVNAAGCTQQVYSAAYLNDFDPSNLCTSIEGAMGYSTSGKYGYSFSSPPNTNFSIVNNTTSVLPPGANCSDYTMTVTLCSTNIGISATKQSALPIVLADSSGQAIAPVDIVFHNSGDFAGAVDASTISETVTVTANDGQPATIQAMVGRAGSIVLPGDTITQTVRFAFSGTQFECFPRTFTITSSLEMTAGVYHCNGYNPPSSATALGSISPLDNFMEDSYAFQSAPGAQITVTIDTVSDATAFDIEGCISDTPQGACLPGLSGEDELACTFAPPAFACPRFGGILPVDSDGDGIYYVRVNSGSGSLNFAGPTGEYRLTTQVTSGPVGACKLVAALDNGANSFLAISDAGTVDASAIPTTTINATVIPLLVRVPAAGGPACGTVYMPMINH